MITLIRSPTDITAAQRSLRVLLVEDHADTAVTFAKLLKLDGYEVQIAGAYRAALDAAASHRFDVLICDIGLPDGNGANLMQSLAEVYPIQGIAVSGFGMPEDIEMCKKAGFSAFILKPAPFEKIKAELDRICDQIRQDESLQHIGSSSALPPSSSVFPR